MIDRGHDLPLVRQADLLRLSRSTLYYEPRPVPAAELAIMRRIDELHLDYPFAGSRMLRDLLRGEGIAIGRERVAAMMRRMGLEALYRRPNTSKPADGHKVYPYLLRGLPVERPNQVWAMDITYIPMARGFVYLAAVVDWFSRRVLAWRLSITLEVEFCRDAVEDALARYGRPEIFNTDQGSQFTSAAFTGLLLDNTIAISMDGRGSWRDNVFVERLWRSVKLSGIEIGGSRWGWISVPDANPSRPDLRWLSPSRRIDQLRGLAVFPLPIEPADGRGDAGSARHLDHLRDDPAMGPEVWPRIRQPPSSARTPPRRQMALG
jgi:putative transposase